MSVWRLQTNTDSNTKTKTANYCLENNVLGMGWSLKESQLNEYVSKEMLSQAIDDRNKITTFEEYSNFLNKYGKTVNSNVNRLYYNIKENDLVWIRDSGIYYLGRVTEKSHWKFCNSQEAFDLDITNQFTDIEWYQIGDESDVPGAIATAFIRGHTLQRINKTGVSEYSKLIFNKKAGGTVYSDVQLQKNSDTFYSLLSTDDCEDLLCLWLYVKFGYIVIPSTNKKATECYECVLKNPKTGQKIYPQVKAGTINLHKEDYTHLNGEVWLFTTKGRVFGEDTTNTNTIHVADPHTIYEFVGSDIAKNILSESILIWYKTLNEK